jgi:hypothetical protein
MGYLLKHKKLCFVLSTVKMRFPVNVVGKMDLVQCESKGTITRSTFHPAIDQQTPAS